MILEEIRIKFYGITSRKLTMKLNRWFLVICLGFNSSTVFSQFNSVIKKEDPKEVSLVRKIAVPQVQDPKPLVAAKDQTEEVEELKKAPKPVDLKNMDRAEAVIVSAMGAHLPIDNLILTSSFGNRIHPITKKYSFHTGVDLSARSASIYAVLHGSVLSTGYNSIIGNYIKLTHGNYTTVYGHLSEVYVKPGDLVKAGEVIGLSGNTGRSTGEHLHFTVKYKGYLIAPLIFLNTILRAKPNDLYIALFN